MSTTISPAPVTPPPRLGATSHVEEPETAQPESRWSIGLRWAGDATSIVLLIAVLWWLSYHDGGWERTALAKVGLLAVIAVPAAAAELRRMSTVVRVLIAMWALGLVASLLFAAERSGFAQPTVTYALVPVVGLVTYRLWRRRWGPPAVAGLLLVSFGLYWYQSFMDWWGLALFEGRQPTWRPLSWHNQSGTLMVAFGLFFAGAALVGRKVVAVAFGLCAAAAFAGAWLSGSRGTLVALAVGAIVLAVTAVVARGWRSTAWRTAALAAASAAVVVGLLGFAQTQSGTDVARTASVSGGSAEHNFLRRFLHMDAAIGMFADAPLTGQGVGSYRNMALPFTSPDSNLTSSAHNEYAEILGEGGLLLAVPFAGLTALALVLGLRRLRGGRHGLASLDDEIEIDDLRWPVSLGAVGVTAALLVHQGADFDWGYPIIPALLGIAVAIAAHDSDVRTRSNSNGWMASSLAGAALALLLLAGSIAVFWEDRAGSDQGQMTPVDYAHKPVAWDHRHATDVAFDLMRGGDFELASWTIDRAIAWNPGHYPIRTDRAVINYKAGDLSGEALVDIFKAGPIDFAGANEVAAILSSEGDHDRAQDLLIEALNLYPEHRTWGVVRLAADTAGLLVESVGRKRGCAAAQSTARRIDVETRTADEAAHVRSHLDAALAEACQ